MSSTAKPPASQAPAPNPSAARPDEHRGRALGLRPRLLLLLFLPLALVMAGYAYLRVSEERTEQEAEFRRRTSVTTTAIKLAVERALLDGSLADVERLTSQLVVRGTDIVRIRLFSPSLTPILDSTLFDADPPIPLDRLERVVEGGAPDYVDRRVDGLRLHSDLVPLRPAGARVQGVLEVAYVGGRLDADLARVTTRLVTGLAVLFLVLVSLMALVLQRFVLRPLATITTGLRELRPNESDAPVPVERRDELGQVAEAFNQMSERLQRARQQLISETERSLELQRQLRRREALSMVGMFCSSVAHEVDTPLTVISGRTEVVLQSLSSDSPLREDLGVVLAQTERIAKIIRSLLDPLRARTPQLAPTTLAEVLDGLLPLLRHTAKSRDVTLGVSVPADLPPFAGDSGQLQQVVTNLTMNALEATAKGGRVLLVARPARHGSRPGLALSITDTGRGMSPEQLARIFDPFFTTKAATEGTGLGLAIVRDIVRAHRGEVRVESNLGVGSTFTVWLPVLERTNP